MAKTFLVFTHFGVTVSLPYFSMKSLLQSFKVAFEKVECSP